VSTLNGGDITYIALPARGESYTPVMGVLIIGNKKHLKNVGPIRHCEPPHALILHFHSPGVATVARRLRIDVHDNDNNNDNA